MTTAVLEEKPQVEPTVETPKAKAQVPRRVVAPVSRVTQNETGFELTVELPGVQREQLDLQVEGNTLSINASSQPPEWAADEKLYREFDFVDYESHFRLPNGLDRNAISADLKDGILQIALPKAAEQLPRKIALS